MELYKATATLFLDARKITSESKYPVKLTIYQRPTKKRYGTKISLSKEEWEKLNSSKLKDEELKKTKIKLNVILGDANKILDELKPFSFKAFEDKYFIRASIKVDQSISYSFDTYLNELEEQGREGTRGSYNSTKNSLLKFKPNLSLTDITPEFLEKYEASMIKAGKSPSTVGIYMRQLRSVFNRAIEAKIIDQVHYPFKKYEIPSSRNIKKALNDDQLKILLNHQPKTEAQFKALDYWVFSYLCNGMNMTDILHLKNENIEKTFLHFNRQKTLRTKKKDLRPIKVPLHERAIEIIQRRKSNDSKNEYLFPILNTGLPPKTIRNRIHKFISDVNDGMEEIRDDLKFDTKLGTYVARHSFATRLMRKGATTQYIKDSLGHSSVAVTDSYLGDFGDQVKSEFSALLTDFS